MDSMRSMQRSLPLSSSRRNVLLSDFRQTAQSLTTLYKNASAEIDQAYSEGAREALELLLSAMDRENLGLEEGEGWRVRQLVMELYQGLGGQGSTTDAGAASPNSKGTHEEEKTEPISEPIKDPKDSQHIQPDAVDASQQHSESFAQDTSFSQRSESDAEATSTFVPQADFTFKTQYSPLFDNLTEPGSPEDPYHEPPSTRVTKPTFSLFSSYNSKVPGKSITITPLGPGAGTKRRTSPQAQRFLSSSHGTRDGTKRARYSGNDQ